MNFIVVRDSAGRCVGCGQNDGNYDPAVPIGGTRAFSSVWVNLDPTTEELRLVAIDDNIRATSIGTVTPKTVAELKAMDTATYSAWFDANFSTAALLVALVKRLLLVIIR